MFLVVLLLLAVHGCQLVLVGQPLQVVLMVQQGQPHRVSLQDQGFQLGRPLLGFLLGHWVQMVLMVLMVQQVRLHLAHQVCLVFRPHPLFLAVPVVRLVQVVHLHHVFQVARMVQQALIIKSLLLKRDTKFDLTLVI